MTHDVFISHSSHDKAIADAVCTALESAKIRCWIAPRDIRPGEKWAAAITNAIENSKIMVLIFSSNSNNSDDVLNEILLAKDAGAIIIPFKIENIFPEGEMKYYLTRTHWLDAIDPPTEKHIQLLVETINPILKVSSLKSTPDVTARVEEVGLETQRKKEKKQQESNPTTYTSPIGMKFTLIPAGEFMMGSEEYAPEKPVHRVKISTPFYLGTYPVIQKEWKYVMGNNPSGFKGDNLPVETVSWNDIQEFIKKLNDKEGGNKYRLGNMLCAPELQRNTRSATMSQCLAIMPGTI
jgi:formylglycine-generating enzyme required for sulfatase activity